MRIEPTKTQKEAMYQVVLDTLKISPCYKAFLVIDDVPEIYMHQFWFTITKIKDSSSYKFKLDKKKFKVRVEVFHEVFQDFLINSLLNHLLMKKLSLSSKNLVTKENGFYPMRCIDQRLRGTLTFKSSIMWEVTETKGHYRTYLAFANGNAIPKQARKRTIAHIKESSLKADDNIIPDDLDVALKLAKSISRTEAKEQEAARLVHETHEHLVTEQSTGRRRQTGAAMLAADTKKAIKASKRDFRSHHQTGGLSEKAGSKPEVPDESKGKTKETNEGAGLKPEVPNVLEVMSSDQESIDLNKTDDEEEAQEDEYELYDDVNVEMKDVEPADKVKGDEEITDAEKVDAEHEEINQEVKEKTKAPPSSSSRFVSSNYEAPATTISLFIPPFIPIPPHLRPIPTPISTEATISTHAVPESKTLFAIHLKVSNLENKVKELKNVNHSTSFLATIKSEVLIVVKEYIGTSLRDALHKVLQRHTTEFIRITHVPEDQNNKSLSIPSNHLIRLHLMNLIRTCPIRDHTTSNAFNIIPKAIALLSCSSEVILADGSGPYINGVAEEKQRKGSDDEDRDEDPPARLDQGLKKRNTSKDAEPSKMSKLTVYEAEATEMPQNQGNDMGTTNEQPNIKDASKNGWFKKPKRPPAPDPE
ncbi:hypothetical protein Tco_0613308 [Tanacetum coccineum]